MPPADASVSAKIGLEWNTADAERLGVRIGKSIGNVVKGSLETAQKVVKSVSTAGGGGAGGAPSAVKMGAAFAVTNKLLEKAVSFLSFIPGMEAIFRLIKVIMLIALLPLTPYLGKIAEKMANFATWLSNNEGVQNAIAAVGVTLVAMYALQKTWQFTKWLSSLTGLGGALGGTGAGGGATILPGIGKLLGAGGIIYGIEKLFELFGVNGPIDRILNAFKSAGGGLLGLLNAVGSIGLGTTESITSLLFKGFDKIFGTDKQQQFEEQVGGGIVGQAKKFWEWITGSGKANEVYADNLDDVLSIVDEQSKVQEKANESLNQLADTGLKAKDVWQNMTKDLTVQWANVQLAFQKMANISANARGWSAGYFYGMTPEMEASASALLTPGGFGTATKAYDPSKYSPSKYSGGAFGAGGSGGLGGIAKGGGRYYDASLLVTPQGVRSFDPGDTILASKRGFGEGGGSNVTININKPSVRGDNDIKMLVREISKNLQTAMRGRVSYGRG